MAIEFDPEKNEVNLQKNGVPLSKGEGALNDPLALTMEDETSEGEQRFVTLDSNTFGSLMVVVWSPRRENARIIRSGTPSLRNEGTMKKEYDFSKAKRGAVVPTFGKTRITIYLDDEILRRFKAKSEKFGKGYQTLINEALGTYVGVKEEPLTPELIRKIVREELEAHL